MLACVSHIQTQAVVAYPFTRIYRMVAALLLSLSTLHGPATRMALNCCPRSRYGTPLGVHAAKPICSRTSTAMLDLLKLLAIRTISPGAIWHDGASSGTAARNRFPTSAGGIPSRGAIAAGRLTV